LVTQTKPVISYSSGNGATYELIEHNGKRGFAVYNQKTDSCAFSEQIDTALPKQKTPWMLTQMPLEYGTDYKLYQEIRCFVYDHVELPDENDYDILTAWVMAAYRFMEFDSFPYVCAIGPQSSGKTRLIKTLWHLSNRGIFGAGLTASAMFHAIDKDQVSVFLDQAEHLANSKEAPDFLALVDNGYQKDGKKFLYNMEAGDYEDFDLYSPKAFASTKTLEGTLESRSIRFSMQARKRQISIKMDKDRATTLRSKLLLYKFRKCRLNEANEGNEAVLSSSTKDGRLIELFLPLYTVALNPSFPSGPSSPSAIIISYMKKQNQLRQDEEQVSVEAQIIQVITECQAYIIDGKLAYGIVTNAFNEGKEQKEKWHVKTVAKKIRDLGFQSCRLTGGILGFYWNDKVLKEHQNRFLIDDTGKGESTPEVNAVQA
jgi:hypothetical protein